ncbi:MAG: amidohydrolase [Chloroflexi bacterium]|nr:MAG: amidohydrolase [Chloroflexota bacterium]
MATEVAVEHVPVVDADAHIQDVHIDEGPEAWRQLEQLHPGWLGSGISGGKRVTRVDGKLYPRQEGRGRGVPIDSANSAKAVAGARDLEVRLRHLDSEGIDIQVLYGGLAIAITSFDDVGFAGDFARAYNDWLIGDVCGRHSHRLRAAAVVPLQDVPRAVDELRRAARLGAVAVMVPPVLGERNLDDPLLLPFFEAAAEAGIAVAVHSAPGMNLPLPAAERFDNYAQVHCLSFPADQMVAFVALAMGGVFDRVPALRAVFLEAGAGWVPYLVHRVHEHYEKRRELLPQMRSEPRDYLARGQAFFSFECEEPLLETYVQHLGHESLVFASDYPHWDSDFPGTVTAVRASGAALGDRVLADILGGNAVRLYGLREVSRRAAPAS